MVNIYEALGAKLKPIKADLESIKTKLDTVNTSIEDLRIRIEEIEKLLKTQVLEKKKVKAT